MALDKDTLKSDLKTAIVSAANSNAQDGVVLSDAIDRIAEAIAVQGSPTAQSNVVPIQIEGELS